MAHKAPRTTPITDELLERIAREAEADPRTVTRRLAGLPVKGRVGERIDRVLVERNISNVYAGAK